MPFDLAAALPLLVPKAVAWAQTCEAQILTQGVALTEPELHLARRVGVAHAERIRLSYVDEPPLPADPLLRQAALHTGLLGPDMAGLTLGHGIYIRRGCLSALLLSHECRHVHQYERAGSIAAFLPLYLQQIVQFGYFDAPYEVDARAHELAG
jgi:hypothetical protein